MEAAFGACLREELEHAALAADWANQPALAARSIARQLHDVGAVARAVARYADAQIAVQRADLVDAAAQVVEASTAGWSGRCRSTESRPPPLAVERPITSAHCAGWCPGCASAACGRCRSRSGPPPLELKFALKVVFVAGTVISCVCAPPSDQERKLNVVPPEVCGEVAPMLRIMPTTFGNAVGRVNGVPSRISWRPVGFEAA